VAVRAGRPGPGVWAGFRRVLGGDHERKAYRCTATEDTPPATLVGRRGRRWPVEQASKEAKEALGLGHYAVRGRRGGHRHTTMTLLAQGFLTRLRRRLGGEGTGADRAPGAPPARGAAPRPAAGRRRQARPHPADPAPHLRRRPRPPQAPPAPLAKAGQLMSQVTL
jgi:hypothetical protein